MKAALQTARVWLRHCPEIDAQHRSVKRAYAHVAHYSNTICVGHAFDDLPESYRAGILLHELGHLSLLTKKTRHTERDADREGERIAGVPIERCDSHLYGENLERVPEENVRRARRFLALTVARRLL